MMKRIITWAIGIAIALPAFSQTHDSAMFKFDIKKFNYLKSERLDSYFLADSTKITFTESNVGYQVQIAAHNSDYSKYYLYHNNTLTLKNSFETFKRMQIGTSRKYDEKGNLVEEENYDAPFVFTLSDLHKKLLSGFHIDIMDCKQKIDVSRFTRLGPVYDVTFNLTDSVKGKYRILRIDGINGNIVLDQTKEYECKTK